MSIPPGKPVPLTYRSPRDDRTVRVRVVTAAAATEGLQAVMGLAALCSPCLLAVGFVSGMFYGGWDFCLLSAAITIATISLYIAAIRWL